MSKCCFGKLREASDDRQRGISLFASGSRALPVMRKVYED
jgi:hypothetical protein